MTGLLAWAVLFAEEKATGPGLGSLLPTFLAMAAAFYFILFLPQKRERNARQQMITALKKNDQVVTESGIFGTVASVRPEANEVKLKIDDNVTMRVTLNSIARILNQEAASGEKSDAK